MIRRALCAHSAVRQWRVSREYYQPAFFRKWSDADRGSGASHRRLFDTAGLPTEQDTSVAIRAAPKLLAHIFLSLMLLNSM
jgi:hypothetical protein